MCKTSRRQHQANCQILPLRSIYISEDRLVRPKAFTLDQVACLQQSDRLRIRQSHGVLKIKVTFAIEVETLICCLYDSAIYKYGNRAVSNLAWREIAEEKVEIAS